MTPARRRHPRPAPPSEIWWPARRVAELFCVDARNVLKICEASGSVRVLRIPTRPPRFNGDDVMALAAECVTRGPQR